MTSRGRTYKALLGAVFTYGQFGVALLALFFVTPRALHILGSRQYGLWLSSGELVGYFLLLDFGVFSILPWLFAQADGRKEPGEVKRLLAHGLAVALTLMCVVSMIFVASWRFLPGVLHLTGPDWQGLAKPLALLIVLLAVNLPLNLFTSLLSGLQDVSFLGMFGLIRAVLNPVLAVTLLWEGHGLYALVIGTALLAPLVGLVAMYRAWKLVPGLLHNWPLPTWTGTVRLFREGIGAWLGGVGVQLMERSSAVVLTLLGNPAIVPVLVCTSRVSQTLTQMAWVMPDSALVGLAQLSGEDKPERLRAVTLSIIRLNLLLAGLMACVVLAINPAFVRVWVGSRFFGGLLLNLLLAAEVLTASLTHALATVVAVQGHRLNIGLATLLQGAIYVTAAWVLTQRFSLEGLLIADLAAPMCSTVPISLWVLRSVHGLGAGQVARELASLVLRATPCLLAAGAYGWWRAQAASFPELVAAGLAVLFGYLCALKPLLGTFPLPAAANAWLRGLRLL